MRDRLNPFVDVGEAVSGRTHVTRHFNRSLREIQFLLFGLTGRWLFFRGLRRFRLRSGRSLHFRHDLVCGREHRRLFFVGGEFVLEFFLIGIDLAL